MSFEYFCVWFNYIDLHGAVELSQTLIEVKLLFSLGMILEVINLLSPVVFCLEHSSQLYRMNLKCINWKLCGFVRNGKGSTLSFWPTALNLHWMNQSIFYRVFCGTEFSSFLVVQRNLNKISVHVIHIIYSHIVCVLSAIEWWTGSFRNGKNTWAFFG